MKKIERIKDKVIIALVYLITIILAVILLMSCEEEHQSKKIADGYKYKIVVIDSCEYIRGTYLLAHKGNCRYCIERNKKLIKEQVDSVLTDIYD